MSTYGTILPIFQSNFLLSKSYAFTTRGLGSGTYYSAGFYESSINNASLSELTPSITFGNVNTPYAAHAFLVSGGIGLSSGGLGPVIIEVSGTSITDAGILTPGDSEIIVNDITSLSLNDFLETNKKWIGQITFTIQNDIGSTQTAFSLNFNYGFNKYEDFNNINFIVKGFECVGLSGATDATFDLFLLKQDSNNWLYSSSNFIPGGTIITSLKGVYGSNPTIVNGEPFAFKVSNLSIPVNGTGSEGIIIKIIAGTNNSIQQMNMHVIISAI